MTDSIDQQALRDKLATCIDPLNPLEHPENLVNEVKIINMIIKDLKDHKDDPVAHTLVITGPDPVPLELPGLVGDNDSGVVIPRHDLRNTQNEADTIIVHQVTNNICCSVNSRICTSEKLLESDFFRMQGVGFFITTPQPWSLTPLALTEPVKLIKCSCSSNKPCSTKRCSCRTDGLCTIFCHCIGKDDCNNK